MAFPEEVFDAIFGAMLAFSDASGRYEPIYKTLKPCALASRQIYNIVVPHIYARVHVRTLHATETLIATLWDRPDLASNVRESYCSVYSYHFSKLDSRPPGVVLGNLQRIPNLPECAVLELDPIIARDYMHMPLADILSWIESCPILQQFTVKDATADIVEPPRALICPNDEPTRPTLKIPPKAIMLRTLHVCRFSTASGDEPLEPRFWRAFARWPSTLILTGSDRPHPFARGSWRPGAEWGVEILGDTVRILRLRGIDFPMSLLNNVPVWFPNLEDLECSFTPRSTLAGPYPKLQRLDIRFWLPDATADEVQSALSTFEGMLRSKTYPNLEHLIVHGPLGELEEPGQSIPDIVSMIEQLCVLEWCKGQKPPVSFEVSNIDKSERSSV